VKQRRGIRRIVIRAGIFLLLGAIVNIAVAWGCVGIAPFILHAKSGRWPEGLMDVDTEDIRWIERSCYQGPIGQIKLYDSASGIGVERRMYLVDAERIPGGGMRMSTTFLRTGTPVRIAAGWPFFALQGGFVSPSRNFNTFAPFGAERLVDAIKLPAWLASRPGMSDRRLPLAPIWPGSAINTLFYAAILWLLFAAPFALRRMRRTKRGLCPACAYPVGASDLCTECGKPVNPRKVEPAST
jgi:hypothetical protein